MATDPVFAAVEQKAREIVNDPDVTDAQAAQWMAGVRWALAAVRWRQEIRVIDRLPIAAPDPTPPALDARPDALREALDETTPVRLDDDLLTDTEKKAFSEGWVRRGLAIEKEAGKEPTALDAPWSDANGDEIERGEPG